MSTFTIKTGDTGPSLTSTLTDTTGDPVNLTGASVKIVISDKHNPTSNAPLVVLKKAAAIAADPLTGGVSYDWAAGDTDTLLGPGLFYGEWEVTFAGGKIESFPNSDDLIIYVKQAMG